MTDDRVGLNRKRWDELARLDDRTYFGPMPSRATIRLTDYPLFDTEVLEPDLSQLDDLADSFVSTAGDAQTEMPRFLFGEVPLRVFDIIFSESDAPEARLEDRAGALLWMMHLSGYYGGRWLRGEIVRAQPEAMIGTFSVAPSEEGFTRTMSRAREALDAYGTDTELMAYARSSLFDTPGDGEGSEPIRGLVDSFGYNLGYMLEILAAPPAALAAEPRFDIEASGLLGYTFASPRLAVLAELTAIEQAVRSGEEPYKALHDELVAVQEAAVPRGRSVWSTGLSVQAFPQSSYDQLLDVSSSFLETVQATALSMIHAAATGAPERARAGALTNSAMIIWLSAYGVGLVDGQSPIDLPVFEESPQT